jgi:hypothetical protein
MTDQISQPQGLYNSSSYMFEYNMGKEVAQNKSWIYNFGGEVRRDH